MAHVAKYATSAKGHMLNHYNRDKEAPCNRSNENIDPERTRENYNLMQREQTPQEYFTQRMGEVYHIDRADLKTMCDWVVTLPQDYKGDTREFFVHCTDFLNERYGAENCLGAFVHMDETTPHMHYAFMPVVPDPKHEQGYKISAKEVLDRKELQHFHDDLQKYLREKMPDREINLYRDGEKEKADRSLQEFKDFKAQERIDHLKEETHRKEIDLQARQIDIDRQRQQAQREQERFTSYFERVEGYKARYDISDREYFMACWNADNGRCKYPEPERYNPERESLANSRFEGFSPEREQEHGRDPER